ncbi:MAG: hypothetical protein IPK04_18140 [Bdellovibrionales bacterium]|nr:hypothetical protein [Bdellovibrionales bacterium]
MKILKFTSQLLPNWLSELDQVPDGRLQSRKYSRETLSGRPGPPWNIVAGAPWTISAVSSVYQTFLTKTVSDTFLNQ